MTRAEGVQRLPSRWGVTWTPRLPEAVHDDRENVPPPPAVSSASAPGSVSVSPRRQREAAGALRDLAGTYAPLTRR